MFPDNKNYTLGRGRIYFGRFLPGTRTVDSGGLRYVGNTPEFNLSSDSDQLDHYDADGPTRVKDDSALLELNRSGTLITDHISPDNLALLFGGVATVVEQAAITDGEATLEGVRRGHRYQIGRTAQNPAGVRGVEITAVTAGAAPLVEGVDYRFDGETGGFYILPGSTVVDEDGTVDVEITYSAPAVSYHQVTSGDNAQIEGELFYEATNSKGARFDYLMPYVTLRPEGDFALKGDEWQQIPFAIEVLKLNDSTEAIYTNGRPGVYV